MKRRHLSPPDGANFPLNICPDKCSACSYHYICHFSFSKLEPCFLYSLQSAVYSIHSLVYNSMCTVYSVQFTVYRLQCNLTCFKPAPCFLWQHQREGRVLISPPTVAMLLPAPCSLQHQESDTLIIRNQLHSCNYFLLYYPD